MAVRLSLSDADVAREHFEVQCAGGSLCALYDPEVDQAWWDHVHKSDLALSIVIHSDMCPYTLRVHRLDRLHMIPTQP